jgi:hypothetical protein
MSDGLVRLAVIFTVDVWHSTRFPVSPDGDDWRRYRIEARDSVTAELVACQMAASHPGWTPVRSVVIDWP